MITIENVAIFTTGGALGYLIRVLLEHHLSRARSIEILRITEFNKAAEEFRSAFVNDKLAIQQAIESPSSPDQGYFLMRKIFTKESSSVRDKALILFKPYITARDLAGFNAAWDNYINWQQHFQNNYKNDIEKSSEMLGHLDGLLKYADPK